MTVVGYKRLTVLFLIVIIGLAGLSWRLTLRCATYRADERGAWLTIRDFQRSRDLATRSQPDVAVQVLDQIAHLPPPRTNRPLDLIIEHERARQLHDVIEHLRTATGEDLGDDPAKWIEKYSKRRSAQEPHRPAGQADGSGDLFATVAADRAFPAAVAGR